MLVSSGLPAAAQTAAEQRGETGAEHEGKHRGQGNPNPRLEKFQIFNVFYFDLSDASQG